MNTYVKFWENIILSGKKEIQPRSKAEETLYDIALFLVKNKKHSLLINE